MESVIVNDVALRWPGAAEMHGCAKLVHAQKGHTSLVIRWKGGDLGCEGVEDGLLTFQCQLLLRVLPAEENWQARDEERPSSLNGGREEPNFWEGREVVINRAREVEIQLSSQRHLFPVSAEGSGSGRRRGKHRLKTSRFVARGKRSGPKQVSERGHKPSARDGLCNSSLRCLIFFFFFDWLDLRLFKVNNVVEIVVQRDN